MAEIRTYKTVGPETIMNNIKHIAKALFNLEDLKIRYRGINTKKDIIEIDGIERKLILEKATGFFVYRNNKKLNKKNLLLPRTANHALYEAKRALTRLKRNLLQNEKLKDVEFGKKTFSEIMLSNAYIDIDNVKEGFRGPKVEDSIFHSIKRTEAELEERIENERINYWICKFDIKLPVNKKTSEKLYVQNNYIEIIIGDRSEVIGFKYNTLPVTKIIRKDEFYLLPEINVEEKKIICPLYPPERTVPIANLSNVSLPDTVPTVEQPKEGMLPWLTSPTSTTLQGPVAPTKPLVSGNYIVYMQSSIENSIIPFYKTGEGLIPVAGRMNYLEGVYSNMFLLTGLSLMAHGVETIGDKLRDEMNDKRKEVEDKGMKYKPCVSVLSTSLEFGFGIGGLDANFKREVGFGFDIIGNTAVYLAKGTDRAFDKDNEDLFTYLGAGGINASVGYRCNCKHVKELQGNEKIVSTPFIPDVEKMAENGKISFLLDRTIAKDINTGETKGEELSYSPLSFDTFAVIGNIMHSTVFAFNRIDFRKFQKIIKKAMKIKAKLFCDHLRFDAQILLIKKGDNIHIEGRGWIRDKGKFETLGEIVFIKKSPNYYATENVVDAEVVEEEPANSSETPSSSED